jgi:hypothetical protein
LLPKDDPVGVVCQFKFNALPDRDIQEATIKEALAIGSPQAIAYNRKEQAVNNLKISFLIV